MIVGERPEVDALPQLTLKEELQRLGFKEVKVETLAGIRHYNNGSQTSKKLAGRYGLVIIEHDREGRPIPTYWYDGTAPIHGMVKKT